MSDTWQRAAGGHVYATNEGVLVVQTASGVGLEVSLFNLTDAKHRKRAYDLASGIQDDYPEIAQRILLILTTSEGAVRV